MPNILAYAMLLIWPLVMIGLFKNLTPDRALIWSFLGALMLLPAGVNFDPPLIPRLDKFTIPSLTALVLCLTMVKHRIRVLPPSVVASVFMIGFLISPFATLMSNRAPVIYGVVFFPGLSLQDAISAALEHAITLIPFILAFNLLSNHQARRNFLMAYMLAGLAYSIPMLLEIRLSPQLSNWVYGFGVQLFGQQIRFGGFRPVVFMGHGLAVAFFTLTTLLSAAILWRTSNSKSRTLYGYAVLYLLIILILCKTVGALVFAVLFLPIILFASRRVQSWAILLCAVLVLGYPVLRSADAIPTDKLLSYATLVQEERAQSLAFRFDNEKILLDHAANKPLFGWGFWDRNRVRDPETGRDLTVTDGYWIIIIGVLGWTGYISVFGLLTLPLFRLWWRKTARAPDEHALTIGMSLLLAVNLLELIPNSSINTMTWLLVGLLMASSFETAKAEHEGPTRESQSGEGQHRAPYARQLGGRRPYSRAPVGHYSREKPVKGRPKR